MTLDERLQAYGVSREDILARARGHFGLEPGEGLYFCGSLVEGLGNPSSDVDLCLVTRRDDIQLTSLSDALLEVGELRCDVSVVSLRVFDELTERLNTWAAAPRDVRLAKLFSPAELKTLHRLHAGSALYGTEAVEALRLRIPPTRIARLQLDLARYEGNALQLDLAGMREAGDTTSMVFAASALLEHAVDALLASRGQTNPTPKWRVRLLSELDDWEAGLPGPRIGKDATTAMLDLARVPESTRMPDVLPFAARIAHFSRRAFVAAEATLLGDIDGLPALPPLSTPTAASHLDVDVTLRRRGDRFELFRLHGARLFELSPRSTSLLLCIDGGASDRELHEFACAHFGETEVVSRMRRLIRNERFALPASVDSDALARLLRA